jgi:hypothetical protein
MAAFGIYWFFIKGDDASKGPKQAALEVGKHSVAFNTQVDTLMQAYFQISTALVDGDTTLARKATQQFIQLSDSFSLEELKKDTTSIFESAKMQIGDIKANALSLINQTDITEIRHDFRMIGESLYPFLKTIHYEGKKLYWQNCPMAFGEDKEANWISNSEEITNPYLGKNHPQYKATMFHCGEVKDSIVAK